VWKVVAKFEDAKEYIAVAEVWIEYPLKHCTVRCTHGTHAHARTRPRSTTSDGDVVVVMAVAALDTTRRARRTG
jgi:hypothetical protein